MPRLLPLPILFLALLLTGCAGTADDSQTTPPLTDAQIIAAIGSIDPVAQSLSWEQEMLNAINQARHDHGDDSEEYHPPLTDDRIFMAPTSYFPIGVLQ